MNAILRLDGIEWWHVAGWTMLHFLWLGTLAGLAAGAGRLVLRRAPANVRYIAALICLAVLAALPVVIAAWVGAKPQVVDRPWRAARVAVIESAARTPAITGQGGDAATIDLTVPTSGATGFASAAAEPPRNSADSFGPLPLAVFALESAVRYLPWLWLLGTPLTFLLLATGVVGAERLRRASRVVRDGPIAEACARLVESLRIGRRVTVAVCERIAAPVLVGILRPIILLPPAALTGWSPEEIEMVLLHELAHVRRWDNLVNLAQRFIEALLFFHPAVWLVSNWVRREGEACCDAVVVGRTNRPHAYAELLLNLAAHICEPSEPGRPRPRYRAFRRGRGRPGSLVSSAMAAGPLRSRICRILQLEDDPMLVSGKSLAVVMSGLLLAATLVVLNLPTRTQAEESTTENTEKADLSDRDAGEDRAATQNNLKNLLLALLNYNDAEHGFPAVANFDANGKPLLSWRVLVLPYLDPSGAELYEKFHLDEPWDSEHNRKLISEMPKAFKNPRIDRPGFTNYLAVVGSECMFDGTAKGIRLAQVSDGTANTIALVEADADHAVEWTKPQDWEFDRAHPTAGLGGLWSDHWFAFRVDGSSCRVSIHNPPDEVGIQFTRAGGETKSLSESAGQRGLVGGELGIGGAKPAPKPVNEFRSKFIPNDKNRYETWVYEITDAPNTKLRLDWIVEMLKRDPSEPKPYFAYNWTNDWTRLEIIAPTEGQKVVESMIKSAQGQKLNLVRFVVGASRFANGDKITITEVRGTAKTFKPGNIYWIKGTYKLGSHNRAILAAYTTAMDAANGTSPSLSVQSTDVARGEGTFSLFLPMSYRGWPHVSFYPADHGESFGGVYFGTGDSVLKEWWDSREAVDATDTAATEKQPSDEDVRKVTIAISDRQTATAESQPGRLRLQIRDSGSSGDKFPSLEDQKLADLAYRRLQLDLEPIGEEELKRAQALGYGGGVLVTSHRYPPDGGDDYGDVQPSDILVGLHAWPTTSLKSIGEVLNRDDLAELNPLKFYVVRPVTTGYGRGGGRGGRAGEETTRDTVVTGRISVNLVSSPAYPEQPFSPKPRPRVAKKAATTTQPIALDADPFTAPTSIDKPALHYDGKTFDQWRTAWQTELSTEKRLEVVKALAAFGANGYGKEAAEAILDVVRQLDWTSIDDSSAGKLKTACIEALAGGSSTGGYRIPTADWLPLLVQRLEPGTAPFPLFCVYLFPRLPAGDQAAVAPLVQLGKNTDSAVIAWIGLKAVDPKLENQEIVTGLRAALKQTDQSPQVLTVLIRTLLIAEPWGGGGMIPPPKLHKFPELEPLLFYPDREVRQTARMAIAYIQPADAPQLVNQLLAIVDDDSRTADRLEALRALAAMGPQAKSAEPKLKQIARTESDPRRFAAALALQRIRPEIRNWGSKKYAELFGDTGRKPENFTDLGRGLEDESQELFPENANRILGGSGGVF